MVALMPIIWSLLAIDELEAATDSLKAVLWSSVNSLGLLKPPNVTDAAAVTTVASLNEGIIVGSGDGNGVGPSVGEGVG